MNRVRLLGVPERVQMKPGYFAVIQQIEPDPEWMPSVRLWAGQLRDTQDRPVQVMLPGMMTYETPIYHSSATEAGRAQLLDQLSDIVELPKPARSPWS